MVSDNRWKLLNELYELNQRGRWPTTTITIL